ncbi:F5/8 type C domain-containing protein [Aequorivita sublithincola DSM 14238]|uniref:F5/8 type C domain-containing protein n=1 Tax=Aequorivita sublithincola (strain DSM 14238 / LMG 21431 / ACAM 643 / 9-3) TaxID=746697 RepID=I3YS73_AEQSU|nr:DUF3999 family protein [Aequorivita sublithincola]AFL79841.1 F5/8 type C domain-containing protein [Aequorivita sublithincola DSM 14238]
MMWKNKSLLFIFLFIAEISFAQLNTYNYSREIKGVSETWHSIELPDEVFGKVSNDLNDFRIYGITEKDTIEVPYLLKIASEKQTEKNIAFKLLNSSKKENTYFFTFEISSEKTINEIQLNFKQENFNWLVNLEGSQDNSEWFSIVEDYRILSIKNEQTDYQFTNVKFPPAKYKYLRFQIKAAEKPELLTAQTSLSNFDLPNYKTYSVENFSVSEDKNLKKTILDINFSEGLPLSLISLKIKESVDYYRPVTIKYLADSIKTEKGWRCNYTTLETSVLSSLENNDLYFYSTITKKLRIEIENFDNRPLKIEGVTAKGYEHTLIARFTEPAIYYLVYGNPRANKPNYDISKFTENIPPNISAVNLSEEKIIDKNELPKRSPLFENKLWLWLIMGVIIALLGWFTIKMMKKS